MKAFKFFDVILSSFVTILLISNIASAAKIVTLGPFTYDAGTLLFPLSYIFGDVLTEVYGFKAARRAIWIGFAMLALMGVSLLIVGALPAETTWSADVGQAAYDKVLGLTPRIILGSLAGFWAGSFANAIVLAKLKTLTAGRFLWTRTIGSTLVGEAIDTIAFVVVAFLGVLPTDVLWSILISNYLFKVGVEVVFTPATYAIVGFLKRTEGVDGDAGATALSPFAFDADGR